MRKKIINFFLSEEGGMVEWIVGAVVIGLGSIAIMAGIADALNQTGQERESKISDIIWTGY